MVEDRIARKDQIKEKQRKRKKNKKNTQRGVELKLCLESYIVGLKTLKRQYTRMCVVNACTVICLFVCLVTGDYCIYCLSRTLLMDS